VTDALRPQIEDANDEFWLSSAKETAGVNGKYYVGGRERSMAAPAKDANARAKLWDILEVQGGVQYPARI